MAAKNIEFTRKELDIIAKNRGIQRPENMSIEDLLNTLSRYDSKRKVKSICRKLQRLGLEKIAKIQNISKNELTKAEKLQKKLMDELKAIARLRRIKNSEKLTKEDLILTLLKSESSALENNFSNNNNTNDDDETYDDKIRRKISDFRMLLNRLGNMMFNKNRKKIKKDLYEIEKNQNIWDSEKEKIYDNLVKMARILDKKEKYQNHDRDDLDYYRIRNIENLFNNVDDYYKPILINNSF